MNEAHRLEIYYNDLYFLHPEEIYGFNWWFNALQTFIRYFSNLKNIYTCAALNNNNSEKCVS